MGGTSEDHCGKGGTGFDGNRREKSPAKRGCCADGSRRDIGAAAGLYQRRRQAGRALFAQRGRMFSPLRQESHDAGYAESGRDHRPIAPEGSKRSADLFPGKLGHGGQRPESDGGYSRGGGQYPGSFFH